MTREPLHYWRRRRGLKLGQYIMNMRLKRIYWHDHQERLYNGSAMLSAHEHERRSVRRRPREGVPMSFKIHRRAVVRLLDELYSKMAEGFPW